MWSFLWCSAFVFVVVFAVLWRQLILGKLYRVSTREPQTYAHLRWVIGLLRGDQTRVRWVSTKDRSSAVGRKHKAQVKRAEAQVFEQTRRAAALAKIRKKLEDTLTRRHAERGERNLGPKDTQNANRVGWASYSLFR